MTCPTDVAARRMLPRVPATPTAPLPDQTKETQGRNEAGGCRLTAADLGRQVRVLGRQVKDGWVCEDCGVVFPDDLSLHRHHAVAS